MNMEKLKFNKAEIAGEIVKELEYDHEANGGAFYQITVRCRRLSENCDEIPVLISGKIIDASRKYLGKYIHVVGQVRSFLKYGAKENGRGKLYLNIFTHDFELSDDDIFGSVNEVYIDGHTCNDTHYKETPNGYEITEMLVCVSRTNSVRSDYIPCLCWNRNARWADGFELGTHVQIKGRLQSRIIKNKGTTTYEVSVFNLNVIDKSEGKDEGKEE